MSGAKSRMWVHQKPTNQCDKKFFDEFELKALSSLIYKETTIICEYVGLHSNHVKASTSTRGDTRMIKDINVTSVARASI